MFGFLKRLFSSKNDRELKKLMPIVGRINDLEPTFKAFSEETLQGKTAEFRQRLHNGEPLDSILPEAFAAVREAGRRVLGMRHYDVQLVGGLVLHNGRIAEMRTGEGKTLVATLPVYTNALLGRGVHVVTVNDYLASRDAEWMGRIYRYLGMSVGTIVHGLNSRQRQDSYGSDITYGTNNEFGFDYLRDNMQFYLADYVQRELYFAIVDEVDSILIDEARTPLIISGRSEESSKLYVTINPLIPKLRKVEIGGLDEYRKFEQEGKTPPSGDYVLDEKGHSVFLTEDGVEKMERLLGIDNLYEPKHIELNHHVQQALRAHALYKRDVNYIVEDGKVVIVDEHTGRKMPGRRWSDGLHQAVEAKEGVRIEEENRTLATVTFQNYFRMYKKLGGMTGTADTEAEEFGKIYNLDVTVIPTNRPMVRQDNNDLIYKTQREKLTKVIDEILETHQKGQPILVGTVSVEKNEQLSDILGKKGIPHQVLNAKHHAREAEIIAQAGRKGSVTIATNMAGRGTDILLGGNFEVLAKNEVGPVPQPNADVYRDAEEYEKALADHHRHYEEALEKYKQACLEERKEVLALGGLHIIGTERHESRRIDNQLRGRAGRQGDVGSSRFYLSLEDDLMRIFAADRIKWLMEKLGMPDGEPIEHPWVTKSIVNAQKKVEAHHFDARKHLLDYDDVMNQQRKTIYRQRRDVLEGRVESDDKESIDLMNLPKDKPWPKDAKNPLAAVIGEAPSEEERAEAMSKVLEGTWNQLVEILEEVVDDLVQSFCEERHSEEWDLEGLQEEVKTVLNVDVDFSDIETTRAAIGDMIFDVAKKYLEQRSRERGDSSFRSVCRWIYLKEIDNQWMEHLQSMDQLREGIGLRGYGQKDPKSEYKKEGFSMFSDMMYRIKENTIKTIAHIKFQDEVRAEDFAPKRKPEQMTMTGGGENKSEEDEKPAQQAQNGAPKVGRNDPCHCGSGKKYKKCHLPIDERAQPNRL